MPSRVLIVDDEKNIRATLTMCLEGMGCQVTAVPTAEAALHAIAHAPHDLCLLDLRLQTPEGKVPGGKPMSGMELLPRLLQEQPDLQVIIMTAYATVDTAVEAMKRGAQDYLPKPFTPAQIRHLVEQSQARRSLAWRVADLEQQLQGAAPEADLATESPRMRAALETLSLVARTDATVLLRGETGTGKGVLARALHVQSQRAAYPFTVVNCPTLSEELLASELFGHARGAFTGAVRDQPGRVEAAAGGTLFLDEVGEISPALQAKLLRFLQEKQFERVGEARTRRADVRIVAATNRDLEADVKAGHFREDLLYRLNVVEIRLPSLRDRPEDILRLCRGFLGFFARGVGRPAMELAPATEKVLLGYGWPGNLRELRNAMERVVILGTGRIVEPGALPQRLQDAAPQQQTAPGQVPAVGGEYTLDEIEREHLRQVVGRSPTLEDAARTLGIDSSTLWRKRKKYE